MREGLIKIEKGSYAVAIKSSVKGLALIIPG
jgi:hypothetical protein